MQVTTGLYRILSNPFIYNLLQNIMGAKRIYQLQADRLALDDNDALLDVGCGPAKILSYLPSVDYWGFDISEQYIQSAEREFKGRGQFKCDMFDEKQIEKLPKFDAVLMSGLLHHLDDAEAVKLIFDCYQALKPGGKLLTIDPCYTQKQNPIARLLINLDRGQNVRNQSEYEALIQAPFEKRNIEITHSPGIPYTHCIMTLQR